MDCYINYRFNDSVEDRFMPFFMGFHKVCGGEVLVINIGSGEGLCCGVGLLI